MSSPRPIKSSEVFAGIAVCAMILGFFIYIGVSGPADSDTNVTTAIRSNTPTSTPTPPVTGVLETLRCYEWKFEDPVQQRGQVRIALLRLRSQAQATAVPSDALIDKLYQEVFRVCGDGNSDPVGPLLIVVVTRNPAVYLA